MNGWMKPVLMAMVVAGSLGLQARPALAAGPSYALSDPGTIGAYAGNVTVLATSDSFGNTVFQASDYAAGYGVSGNGTTLFGAAGTSDGAAHAFIWTPANGFTDLGALGSPSHASFAAASSADAGVVVGFSRVDTGAWHAFRWTSAGGMVDLGTADNSTYSSAWGVSADGSVIAGGSFTATSIDRAMRWTQSGGWQNLGTLGTGGYSDAFGVSADGHVIVGMSTDPGNAYIHAFRWTEGGGMTDLGTLGNATGASVAAAVDGDGGVVVGKSVVSGAAYHAFRWTEGGGMTDLGTIGNAAGNSTAFGVNKDGSVIVGSSAFGQAGDTHAFVWTAPTGIEDLNNILTAAGVDMAGVTLTVARGVSSDGDFVAGSGLFPGHTGSTHAFLARIGGSAAGVTSPDSVVASITDLVNSHQAQMITQVLEGQTYLGVNEQVSCGDCGGAQAAFGSFNLSAHGRHSLSNEWTVLGGFGFGNYKEKGARVSQSASAAASLRYDPANMGSSRPYFEFGGSVAPSQSVTYNRPYDNGAGQAAGIGRTHSTFVSAFVKAGWVARITRIDELGAAISLSQARQSQGGYEEATGSTNPFDAVYAKGTDRANIVSISGQYTHLFGRHVEVTADVALSRTFNSQTGVKAAVSGLGAQPAQAREFTWAQPGLRIGYRASRNLTLDAFVNATIGPKAIGSSAHGGFGFSMKF